VNIQVKFQNKYPDITVPNISIISRLGTCFYKRGSIYDTMTVHPLLPSRQKKTEHINQHLLQSPREITAKTSFSKGTLYASTQRIVKKSGLNLHRVGLTQEHQDLDIEDVAQYGKATKNCT